MNAKAASRRFRPASRRRALRTCISTVFGESLSRRAISFD
jgi:hypothetical protein